MSISEEELQLLLEAKRVARLLRESKWPVVRAIPHAAGRSEESLVNRSKKILQEVVNERS